MDLELLRPDSQCVNIFHKVSAYNKLFLQYTQIIITARFS